MAPACPAWVAKGRGEDRRHHESLLGWTTDATRAGRLQPWRGRSIPETSVTVHHEGAGNTFGPNLVRHAGRGTRRALV